MKNKEMTKRFRIKEKTRRTKMKGKKKGRTKMKGTRKL
jgi:hypothetical protein